jgi:hypothetical protein
MAAGGAVIVALKGRGVPVGGDVMWKRRPEWFWEFEIVVKCLWMISLGRIIFNLWRAVIITSTSLLRRLRER